MGVKESVVTAVKESVGFALALYVGCDVHELEGSTVMVAECVAERDTRPTEGVAPIAGDPVAAADCVKDAVAHAESVARGLVVPVAQADADVVAQTVTVCVGTGDAVELGEGVKVPVREPDTVFVREPPTASLAEPEGTADAEEESDEDMDTVNVALPVGEPGGGRDTVAELLGLSIGEGV